MKKGKSLLNKLVLISATAGFVNLGVVEAATSGKRQTGVYNYAEVLQKSMYFYDVQRSGDLPYNYRVSWRGDSALNDGSDVGLDLSGGFYDAGDHVKFGLPMAFSFTMLAWGAIEYPSAYSQTKQDAYLKDTLRYGMDYLMRCHVRNYNGSTKAFYGQVGDAGADHAYWGSPETMTMQRPAFKVDAQHPGTELAAETAACMAAVSMVFKSSDSALANKLIDHAKALYAFADTYRGEYHKSITAADPYYKSWSGYDDELMWGALWLYRATGEQSYFNKAKGMFDAMGYTLHNGTHSWDNKFYASYLLFALVDGGQAYRNATEKWLNHWAASSGGKTRTPDGLSWESKWGPLRYAANTAFCSLVYADKVSDPNGKYSNYGKSQINYMLGDNKYNRSYVCGFGVNPPVKPHHRSSHGSTTDNVNNPVNSKHVLYGALVGGPDQNGNYTDSRTDYEMNEVAMDYNAGFTGALAALYSKYGGYTLNNISDQTTPKKDEGNDNNDDDVPNTNVASTMSSPANGSTLPGSSVTFKWKATTGEYHLYIGTSVGGNQIFSQAASGTQKTVSNLPTNGSKVYVRLWTKVNGGWQSKDYSYNAKSSGDNNNNNNNDTTNYVKNGGFESWMSSWAEQGNGVAGYVQKNNPYKGSKNLAHWKGSSYEIKTYQNITGIPNGTYKAFVYVKSTGGQSMCKFSVNGFNSQNSEKSKRIWKTSTYKLMLIKDIEVTNGKCTVSLYSKAPGGKWATFDDVTLIKQ